MMTVYSTYYGWLNCGDIIMELKQVTDKNGDIWVQHQRGWTMVYHAASKTYYMQKVEYNQKAEYYKKGSTNNNSLKFENESKELFNGKLSLNLFKEDDTPEKVLESILENRDYSNEEKLEFYKKVEDGIKEDEEKIKIQLVKLEKLKETLESVKSGIN